MNDETINRILDMIESSGAVVLPIIIACAIMSIIVFVVALLFIIKSMKSMSKDRKDFLDKW